MIFPKALKVNHRFRGPAESRKALNFKSEVNLNISILKENIEKLSMSTKVLKKSCVSKIDNDGNIIKDINISIRKIKELL